ncbi:MAG: hypothetical protein ACJASU_000354 [Cognaticolwellia sp.]|jgi:hypothetical protein
MRTWSRLVPIFWTETLSKFTAGAGDIDNAKERVSELSIISLIVIKLNSTRVMRKSRQQYKS